MRKFTYSRKLGDETFTAVEFDSFDEARKVVDKAVAERNLEIHQELQKGLKEVQQARPTPNSASSASTVPPGPVGGSIGGDPTPPGVSGTA